MKLNVEKIYLGLTILFGFLFLVLYGIKSFLPNIVLNVTFWTRWDEILIALTLFMLSALLYVTQKMKHKMSNITITLIKVFLLFVLIMLNIFGYHGMRSLENEDHKIYLISTGFGERGISTVYLQENWLYSRKISSTVTEAALYDVDYQLDGDILHVNIYEDSEEVTETIDIDLTLYD